MKHAVKESDELYLWLLRQVVGKMEGLSLHLSLFMWDLLSCLLFWGEKHMPFGIVIIIIILSVILCYFLCS